MSETIPDPESLKFDIPPELLPNPEKGPMFPVLTEETIKTLAENKWLHFGLLVVIVNDAGEILLLTHKKTDRVQQDARGVIGETLTYTRENDHTHVEQVVDGLSRVFYEELGVTAEEVPNLNLSTREYGAWDTVSFPRKNGEYALGIVLVLQADTHTARRLAGGEAGFDARNKEIAGVSFARPEAVELLGRDAANNGFRPGTSEIIRRALDLMTAPYKPVRVQLPRPTHVSENAKESLRDITSAA